jgi:HSP20 family protein
MIQNNFYSNRPQLTRGLKVASHGTADGAGDSLVSAFRLPTQVFETASNDYELCEETDESILSVELPGFDPAEIDVAWDDRVIDIAAERGDERRDERRTDHQRFPLPE